MVNQPKLYQLLTKTGRIVEKAEVKLILKYGLKPYQPPPYTWMDVYKSHRKSGATILRWELIQKYLPDKPFTGLDIGCNIGFFSFKMIEHGADLVLGIDSHRGPIIIAEKVKQIEKVQHLAFCQHSITPNNVRALGSYDVILFLSVFHHINLIYGFDKAKYVLSEIIKRTKKLLFFETGQSNEECESALAPNAMPDMGGHSAKLYIKDLLRACGAKSVIHLGEITTGGRSTRSLFIFMVKNSSI